ncbi:hypothetical protein [Vibrio parahaemolyticus]|nr:hypothetical protein [Vibrio parahaemolyticus]MEB2469213.1 hypothetical protein [Vibrio parahaemolyticus]
MYAEMILVNFGKKRVKLPAMKGSEFKSLIDTLGTVRKAGKK